MPARCWRRRSGWALAFLPPKLPPIRSGQHPSKPPPTHSHGNVVGTAAGRRGLGPRDPESPVLRLGRDSASRPGVGGGGSGGGLGPCVSPQALPGERCLQTHCRAQALGRERPGARPCCSGQPGTPPAGEVGLGDAETGTPAWEGGGGAGRSESGTGPPLGLVSSRRLPQPRGLPCTLPGASTVTRFCFPALPPEGLVSGQEVCPGGFAGRGHPRYL